MAGVSVDKLFFELGIDPQGMKAGATQAQGIFKNISTRAKVAIGVLGGFSVVFAAIGIKSIAAANKFEDAFNEVRTLIDETITDSEKLRKEVLELSAVVGRPPEEVSRGLYQVISAGVTDAGEAMDVLTIATRASIGGLTDQFTAVDAVTTVLNAYNLEASEAEHVTDLMLNAVKEGKLTFGDLAANVGLVVTTAAQAGIGFDEVSAAMATMTKAGLSSEVAVTALNNLILRIIVPQDEAAAAAERMGVEFGEAALKSKGLTGIMAEMSKAANGSITKFSEMLPEIRGLRAGTVLAGTGFEEFSRIMLTTQNVAGTTTQFFNKIKQSVSETAKEINARLTVAFINLGAKILPAINSSLQGILNLIDEFTRTDLEKSIAALEKISGTQALIRRLELQQEITDAQEKQTEATEELNDLIKQGAGLLARNQGINVNTGIALSRISGISREIVQNILDMAEGEDALNKLTQVELGLSNEVIDLEKKIGEARAVKNKKEADHLVTVQTQRQGELALVSRLLLLVATRAVTDEEIAKKQKEINEILKLGLKVTEDTEAVVTEQTKSITEQQKELKDKIDIIEMGAASEIELIKLTGELEKTKSGEIKEQIAEIRNATIDRLDAHLKEAILVYGKENQFVQDLKIAIAKLKLEAQEEIEITLKTDLVLQGIDKSSRAVAGLSRELGILGDRGELAIRRVGDLAQGMGEFRSALSVTKGTLVSKVIPAVGLAVTGFQLLSAVFGKTDNTAEKLARSTAMVEEKMRSLNNALEAQVGLSDLTKQVQLRKKLEKFQTLFFTQFNKGQLESFLTLSKEDFIKKFDAEAFAILENIGKKGIRSFFSLINGIGSALIDGFIDPVEAANIDKLIAKVGNNTFLLELLGDEMLNTLVDIENLTEALIALGEAATEAAKTAAERRAEEIAGMTGQELINALLAGGVSVEDLATALQGGLAGFGDLFFEFRNLSDIKDLLSALQILLFGVKRNQEDENEKRDRDRGLRDVGGRAGGARRPRGGGFDVGIGGEGRGRFQPDIFNEGEVRRGQPKGGGIVDKGITTDFRQFVGITEIQGNVLLGILNSSLDVQRQQLQIWQGSLNGIDNVIGTTIEEFNLEVNFNQPIGGVSDISSELADQTIIALRSQGIRI